MSITRIVRRKQEKKGLLKRTIDLCDRVKWMPEGAETKRPIRRRRAFYDK